VDESVSRLLAQRLELQDDTVTLDQLVVVKEIGRGTFGIVFLVVHKSKGSLYAVKAVSRAKIRIFDVYESLRLEREILLQLDHLLIMKLVKTFKDSQRVYFLMELVQGMDLFDGLRSLGKVKEPDARFYAACLLLIMEHLHERSIVYRDLKPENVVIDHTGYLKLVDFGTAKVIEGRTFTIIGTPQYMAPEVILGKGYGLAVDLWSIGAMLFEFLTGSVPFGEGEDDPLVIYEKILRDNVEWPATTSLSEKGRCFAELLLSKNEATRNIPIPKLRQDKWFFGFEWEKLLLKQLTPPFVPAVPSCAAQVKVSLQQPQLIGSLPIEAEESGGVEGPEGWDRHF
jgi:cGMP-dependent protein kinase